MKSFALILSTLWLLVGPVVSPEDTDTVYRTALEHLVQNQQSDILFHRTADLDQLYAPRARDALQVAQVRSEYLLKWAAMRGIHWTGIAVRVRTPIIRVVNPDLVRFYALEREDYRYVYDSLPQRPLSFGIASRHWLAMARLNDRWVFVADDWTNPVLPDDMAGQTVPHRFGGSPPHYTLSTNRRRALDYANRYCGDAPGCGNDQRYNRDYQDYNLDGGDCTNWISQVLYAGGFPMTPVWNYDHAVEEGTAAWANAGALAEFLKDSGRAQEFAHGPYEAVTAPSPRWPEGAIETLIPGDLISYQQHGHIAHTAVVVGWDPKGVVLTNAHTNDRYHVPWDFGWKDTTTFYLWHVHYPADPPIPPPGKRAQTLAQV